MILSISNKNNVYHCKPKIYYIKVQFQESILYRHVFVIIVLQLPKRKCSTIKVCLALIFATIKPIPGRLKNYTGVNEKA